MYSGKVAVPYYGSLHRAKLGYERIYFLVEAHDAQQKELDVKLGVWDQKKQESLPEWLKNNGVASLVCREEPELNLNKAIANLGIRVLGAANNDASRLMQSLLV